ncbi:MAG TPA: CpaF family protein, partial [Sphingomicrobium sp.]
MNAFGKRSGLSSRPSFGVAKPMKGGGSGGAPSDSVDGGEQFPPIDELTPDMDSSFPIAEGGNGGAMDRLNNRQNASGDRANSKQEGFEASVHRIKEQVLPRLLERVDPEAAATLSKDELAEEFRPII